MEWLSPILTGGAAVAIIKIIDNVILWWLNRKHSTDTEKRKKQEAEIDETAQTVKSLKAAQMIILHDRLKYLCRRYIENTEIRFDDREDLLSMHEIYHKLGGNGHLDKLISQVMELPLKS